MHVFSIPSLISFMNAAIISPFPHLFFPSTLSHSQSHSETRTLTYSLCRALTHSIGCSAALLPPPSLTHTLTHTHPFHKVLAAAVLAAAAAATASALKEEGASETRCSRVNEHVASQPPSSFTVELRNKREGPFFRICSFHFSTFPLVAVFLPSPRAWRRFSTEASGRAGEEGG